MEERKRHQLCMDVPESVMIRLRMAAAKRNISMNKWVMRQIERLLIEEEEREKLNKDINELYPS